MMPVTDEDREAANAIWLKPTSSPEILSAHREAAYQAGMIAGALAMYYRYLAWLGYWRDHMPHHAVASFQELDPRQIAKDAAPHITFVNCDIETRDGDTWVSDVYAGRPVVISGYRIAPKEDVSDES